METAQITQQATDDSSLHSDPAPGHSAALWSALSLSILNDTVLPTSARLNFLSSLRKQDVILYHPAYQCVSHCHHPLVSQKVPLIIPQTPDAHICSWCLCQNLLYSPSLRWLSPANKQSPDSKSFLKPHKDIVPYSLFLTKLHRLKVQKDLPTMQRGPMSHRSPYSQVAGVSHWSQCFPGVQCDTPEEESLMYQKCY